MERHILLIDDDVDELDFFLLAQKEMPGSFRCSYLSNAAEAVESIPALAPDLVFLDINMPAVNGLEFLHQIKDTGICQHIPIVLYSTHIDSAVCEKAKKLGAAYCVKKPVMLNSFRQILKELLDKL